MENYDVNYVVQISTSTGVYISVNYCSLQSCTPLDILCFGPVCVVGNVIMGPGICPAADQELLKQF